MSDFDPAPPVTQPATPNDPDARPRHATASGGIRALDLHVVAHTHWDREWYHNAARFRARLVALVDAVLEAPLDASQPFLFDGQTVVLADYLTVRPERQADVRSALTAGTIEAGPWYVLADNLIPSGEAIIRNLEAGRRWLSRAGAAAPRVAYCPDSFGHPAAMPQIASGFGCDTAVVWRGFGGATFPASDCVWWESADGSRVLAYHLAPDGYELGNALPTGRHEAQARWQQLAAILASRNATGCVLLPVGADHHAPSPRLHEATAAMSLAAVADGSRVTRGSLGQAMGALLQAARAAESRRGPLPVVRGELRDSYGYTWTLQGTFGTRAAQKRANARLERALLRDVEPWSALAWLHGAPASRGVSPNGEITLSQLPVLTAATWEALLRTHPHDTLCGCSIDAVAREMSAAQQSVGAMTVELREAALRVALQHDAVRARARAVDTHPLTVVRNRLGRPREGLAELTLVDTLAHVAVGPGSGPGSGRGSGRADRAVGDPPLAVADLSECVVQPLSMRERHARRESPQHYPDNDLVRERRVLAWVPQIPANGVRVLDAHTAPSSEAPTPAVLQQQPHYLEMFNGLMRVRASSDGVTVIRGDRLLTNALTLETCRDAGDSYTPSLRGAPEALSLVAVRAGCEGPLRSSLHLVWLWKSKRERIRVRTTLVLDAGADFLQCHVRGVNARRDHRLQLVWNTDVVATCVMADAAMGPVMRTPLTTPLTTAQGAALYELPPSTIPMHRWLAHSDDRRGAAVLSDGLAEGDVGEGRLAVTLVRSIGELSRNDLPERPGHAGWPSSIPDAQSQGPFAARLALQLHGPLSTTEAAVIDDAADAFLLPLVGETWRDLDGAPREVPGPELVGDGLRVSAIHITDDGTAMRLRTVNRRDGDSQGQWILPIGAWQYRLCRLDGTPLHPWVATSNVISFTVRASALVTFEVRRAELSTSV